MSYLKIDKYGNKFWYNGRGEVHREGGPAIEFNYGPKLWYINGKYHREDGPAVECNSGYKQWWYNGEYIGDFRYEFTQEKFEIYLRELKIKEYW